MFKQSKEVNQFCEKIIKKGKKEVNGRCIKVTFSNKDDFVGEYIGLGSGNVFILEDDDGFFF